MPQEILIQGDLVTVRDVTPTHTVALADFLPHIEKRHPIVMPLLPDRVKTVRWDSSNLDAQQLEVLIQVEPSVRSISVRRTRTFGAGAPDTQYRVSLPYLLFIFTATTSDQAGLMWDINEYRVFNANAPLTSLDQKVCAAMLPNVYSDGRICFGNTGVAAGMPLHDRLNAIVNQYYLTSFDTSHHVRDYYLPYGAGNNEFEPWVEHTAEDPNCWRSLPEWTEGSPEHQRQHWYTVKDLLGPQFDRTTPIALAGDIPDMRFRPTFGVAEEWVAQHDRADILRLDHAIDMWLADHPEAE